jgi:hypothetical protein
MGVAQAGEEAAVKRTVRMRTVAIALVCVAVGLAAGVLAGAHQWRGKGAASSSASYSGALAVPSITPGGGWRAGGKGIDVARDTSPSAARATTFALGAGRNSYTFAKRNFFPSQNWGASQWLFVEWRGTGSGIALQLFVDTSPTGKSMATFDFVDTVDGWTTLSFDLDHPQGVAGKLDLGHVYRIRVATVRKQAHATFAIGKLSLSAGGTG